MKTSQKIYLPFKRLIGIIGSLVGILFCFGLFWWWIFIVNWFVTKGHPIFSSRRVGKDNKTFKLYKFRSMKFEANPTMPAGSSDVEESLTKFGRFLRASSLDETLQLFNILIGQMSFIGPRPLINVGNDSITINERNKNGSIVLKPGISGYAQIHSRSNLDCVQKAEYDFYYLQHFSLWLDIRIFCKTLFSLFGSAKGK